MKVLIFKLSPIGDTVVFLPVLQEIRRRRPDWHVTVCATPACAGLFGRTLLPSDIWTEERHSLQKAWRNPVHLARWIARVRGLGPDAVLLSFDQSSVARLLAVLSGARVRIGGSDSAINWNRGLTHEVTIGSGQTLADWEWEMGRVLAGLTSTGWPERTLRPELPVRTGGARGRRPRILVHPGASRAYQMWPIDRFAALAERLARDFEVLWIRYPGGPESAPGGAVRCESPGDLLAFLDLVGGADLFVGNHSGPFHLACAAGLACVVPTGPTLGACDPPWLGGPSRLLRMKGLSCMPCDKLIVAPHRCTNEASPMACMAHWSVDRVEAACREVLAEVLRSSARAP